MRPDAPIRVAQFTEAVARGGAEEHILMLLQGLDRTRLRPYFICTHELAEKMGRDMPPDVEVIPLGLREPTQVGKLARLRHLIRERKIEIFHSHGFYSSMCASAVARWSGVPVVIETSHGREAWRKGWKAHYFIDRMVGRVVDHYIAVSESNARYLIREKNFSEKKITVIYPGSDLRRFDPDHRPPEGVRESAGIGQGDRVIVFVGRLEPQKGHRVLLDAMPGIRNICPNVKLICVGEGSLREQLLSHVRGLGLEETVRFIGYTADVRDWLALADLTVLPSFHEGLPVTPIESLASGKPVVATAVDGTPEVVIDGKTGLTVPPDDPARLGEAICQMLADPAKARSLAAQGREWVLSEFGMQRMVRRTGEFYLECWRNRRGQMSAAEKECPFEPAKSEHR